MHGNQVPLLATEASWEQLGRHGKQKAAWSLTPMRLLHNTFPVPSLRPLTKQPDAAEGHRLVFAFHVTESTRIQYIKFSKASSKIFCCCCCLFARSGTNLYVPILMAKCWVVSKTLNITVSCLGTAATRVAIFHSVLSQGNE